MRNTIVVNLTGAPGAGKSTLAALVFSKLKMQNVSCELVSEFAKDLVWDNSMNKLNDQLYVFSEQFHRVWRLKDKVDVIITDSPMLLSIFYNCKQDIDNRFCSAFDDLVLFCHNRFTNLNFFIKRDHEFESTGRRHSEEESNEMEQQLLTVYNKLEIPYEIVYSSEEYADKIVSCIINTSEE